MFTVYISHFYKKSTHLLIDIPLQIRKWMLFPVGMESTHECMHTRRQNATALLTSVLLHILLLIRTYTLITDSVNYKFIFTFANPSGNPSLLLSFLCEKRSFIMDVNSK